MNGKRIVLWMLMMAFTLGCTVFPAFSEVEEPELLSIVKVEDDCVWIQTDRGLVPFSKEGQVIGEAAYPGADCYAMADDGSIFYSKDGVIYAPDTAQEWETPCSTIDKLQANEGYVVFGSEKDLGRIDRNTGEVLTVPLSYAIGDIAMYDGESCLVLPSSTSLAYLEMVSCATLQTLQQGTSAMQQNFYSGVAVDAGAIYLTNSIVGIDKYSTLTSLGETYKAFVYGLGRIDMTVKDGVVYVLETDGFTLYPVREKTGEEKVITLVGATDLLGTSSRITKAVELFEAENPEYTVQLVSMPKNEVIKTALMANEPGYDILVLHTDNSLEYKRSGLLYDLSDNFVIAENLSQYIDMPFLWEKDGRLFGVPIGVNALGFDIKASDQAAYSIDVSLDWTWDDFFALAETAQENGRIVADLYEEWSYLRKQYACLYWGAMEGTVDYDTETFRSLVERAKALSDANLLNLEFRNNPKVIMSADGTSPFGDWGDVVEYIDMGMPMIEGKHVTPVEMTAFYANAYGENLDAVVRFLEIYSSKEVQMEYVDGPEGIFFSDLTEYTSYSKLWSRFKNYIPSEDEFARYKFALETGYLTYVDPEFEKVERELFRQFINDELTLDEFIAELQERADLMLGE